MSEYYDRSIYNHLEVINKMSMYLPKVDIALGIRGGRLTYKQFVAQQSLVNFRIKVMKSYLSYFFEIEFCRYPVFSPSETGVYKVLVERAGEEELYLSFDFWDSTTQKWSWFDKKEFVFYGEDHLDRFDSIVAFENNN